MLTDSDPTCGIIIPLFNKAGQIVRALESTIHQSLPFDEIIVVDDCSSDESASIVERFISDHQNYPIKLIYHERNGGPGAARNTGIAASQTQYFCFLDADDFLHPNAREEMHHILRSGVRSPGLVISQILEQDTGAIRPNVERLKKLRSTEVLGSQLLKIKDWASAMSSEPLFCSGGNVLINGSLRSCRFDPTLRNFEDWDYYFRLCQQAELVGLDILVSRHVTLTYTADDQESLSRSHTLTPSLRVIPAIAANQALPLKIRRLTVGVWMCHVAQRSSILDGIILLSKALRQAKSARPDARYLFAALLALVVSKRGWQRIRLWRRRALYA